MAAPIGRMNGNEDSYNGSGGPASAAGKSSVKFRPNKLIGKSSGFRKDSGGKLSKSGATTRSESFARLRGKGALS